MKNRLLVTGMLAFALVYGMTVVGCDDGSTNGDNVKEKDEPLPKSSGVNAVGGKTYYYYTGWWDGHKTVFSATANSATSGTYTIGRVATDDYGDYVLVNDKFTYTDSEIGTYSWNEGAKTVTLKPQKIISWGGKLSDRSEYRKEWQVFLKTNDIKEDILSMGFSSVTAYVNYEVNEAFSNKTHGYSFSTDGTALFLEEPLPANKGVNELSGKTYYGNYRILDESDNYVEAGKDEDQKYVFTASGYTFTEGYDDTIYETVTGSYAYDSRWKTVYLRPEKINGEDRAAYYAELTADSEHYFVDDYAYRAAETNEVFGVRYFDYDATDKLINDED